VVDAGLAVNPNFVPFYFPRAIAEILLAASSWQRPMFNGRSG
jgi:hypothetical protein